MQVEEAVSVAVAAVEAARAGQEAGQAEPQVCTLDHQEQLTLVTGSHTQPLPDHANKLGQAHLVREQPLDLKKRSIQAQVHCQVSISVSASCAHLVKLWQVFL